MEPFGVAAVRDRAVAVDLLFIEAERHAVERADAGGVEIVHHARGFGFQQHAAIAQMRDHELAHVGARRRKRSEEHTSELQSLMRISYAVFCLKKQKTRKPKPNKH